MPDRRRPHEHTRIVNGKVVPVNKGVHHGPLPHRAGPEHVSLQRLAAPPEEIRYLDPIFNADAPLDRDQVAAAFGPRWDDAQLYTVALDSGYSTAGFELESRHVNYLAAKGVDPVQALQNYFAEEAQRHPNYAWGANDSWTQEFSLGSVMLFDADSNHVIAGVTSRESLAAHGLLVLNTREAEWDPSFYEYSKESYSFRAHHGAEPQTFPQEPYEKMGHSVAVEKVKADGRVDPAEFSVLVWLGEVELRDNYTYAVTTGGYDPERNHLPPWAVQNFLNDNA